LFETVPPATVFGWRAAASAAATGVNFTGSATWRVRLTKGVYRFRTDAKHLAGRLRVR
jgi:hypothetical protein